jgi:hypothetical protein
MTRACRPAIWASGMCRHRALVHLSGSKVTTDMSRGVPRQPGAASRSAECRSGDEIDALVGIDECLGCRPAVDDSHDTLACFVHEPSWSVEDPPAQCRLEHWSSFRRNTAAGTTARGRPPWRRASTSWCWPRSWRTGTASTTSPSIAECAVQRGQGTDEHPPAGWTPRIGGSHASSDRRAADAGSSTREVPG